MIPDPQRALTPEEQAEAGLPRVWPFAIADRVRFGEVDRLGHVNNAAYLTWYETARTAWIIEVGLSDWKMLRPMSTPEAPDWIALYASSIASRSPIFLPPAITIGTGVS